MWVYDTLSTFFVAVTIDDHGPDISDLSILGVVGRVICAVDYTVCRIETVFDIREPLAPY